MTIQWTDKGNPWDPGAFEVTGVDQPDMGTVSDAATEEGDDGNGTEDPCGQTAPTCVLACNSTSACVYPGMAAGGIYDDDNYSCADGACAYKGCLNDVECKNEPTLAQKTRKCVDTGCGIKACLAVCGIPDDCIEQGAESNPLVNADNYECVESLCRYIGCTGNQECKDAYASLPEGNLYVCQDFDGIGGCVLPCASAADCVPGYSSPVTDLDNYSCDGQVCRYTGCNGTQECKDTYRGNPYEYVCSKNYFDY